MIIVKWILVWKHNKYNIQKNCLAMIDTTIQQEKHLVY